MDLDLHLDLMEFPGRLIGLPFVKWVLFWECFFVRVQVFPYLFFFSFVNRLFGTWEDFRAFVCFPFSPALCNWFVHFVWNALGQKGSVGTGFGPMAFVAYGGLQPPSV